MLVQILRDLSIFYLAVCLDTNTWTLSQFRMIFFVFKTAMDMALNYF